jgi:3-hydroxyisobutyrate dehydrogenase-like beta-hydroxyacid dehydrogenase
MTPTFRIAAIPGDGIDKEVMPEGLRVQRVGLVGAGLMGQGIALNLLRNGHALVVLEHPGNQPLDELLALGARTCATARDLAGQSDVVILCVTGAPQVESVLCGAAGVLEGLAPGAIVVDCSTSLPATSTRMDEAVRAAGGRFIDAPMTRTVADARAGRLNLLVGGDDDTLQRVLPLLRCFAENITHAGSVGAGHRLKLLHNFVALGCIALISEAAGHALSSGIAPDVFVDVLASGGGAGVPLERIRPVVLDRHGPGMQFSMSNALKDLRYYTGMVHDARGASEIADAIAHTLEGALANSDPAALVSDLVHALADRNRRALD